MNKTHLLNLALQSLCPNSEYTFNDADYSTVNWIILEGDAPTEKEVQAEIKRIKESMAKEEIERASRRSEILTRLGITEDEAKLLLS